MFVIIKWERDLQIRKLNNRKKKTKQNNTTNEKQK